MADKILNIEILFSLIGRSVLYDRQKCRFVDGNRNSYLQLITN